MTSKDQKHESKDNTVVVLTAGVVLLILLGALFMYLTREKAPPMKQVQALEKNEVFCNYSAVGSDFSSILQLARNMQMQRMIVKNEKGEIVGEFEKEMPADASALKIKNGFITVYAAIGNMHRYCDLKIEKKLISEKNLHNKDQ